MLTDEQIAEIAGKLTEDERATVLAMSASGHQDFGYRNFAAIEADGGSKNAARSLRAKGIAVFAKGLWTDDGEPYGSGYALNEIGLTVRNYLENSRER